MKTTIFLLFLSLLFIQGAFAQQADYYIYSVKSTDKSLWSICNKYNTTTAAVLTINNKTTTDIHPNEKLKIPLANGILLHIVCKEDKNLWQLSQKLNSSIEDIKLWNDKKEDKIVVGEQLLIPTHFHIQKIYLENCKAGEQLEAIKLPFPIVTTAIKEKEVLVEKINQKLLHNLELSKDAYANPKQEQRFYYLSFQFEWQIKNDILYIHTWGEYLGANVWQEDTYLFFDLKTGEQLEELQIPLAALFHQNKFKPFYEGTFLPKVIEAAQKATANNTTLAEHYNKKAVLELPAQMQSKFLSIINDSLVIEFENCYASPSSNFRSMHSLPLNKRLHIKIPNTQLLRWASPIAKKSGIATLLKEWTPIDYYLFKSRLLQNELNPMILNAKNVIEDNMYQPAHNFWAGNY